VARKKTNNAARRRRSQMTIANPLKKGAYEEVWFDERGNPVAAGAFEEVWSDLTGAKPKSKRGGRRRTTKPTAIIQPAAGIAVTVEPLASLSDPELKAKFKSVFPGRGRCPMRATMIKKLKAKGETSAAVVTPVTSKGKPSKKRAAKPKIVKATNVAPDKPSAPKRAYKKIRKSSDIDSLTGPFTIDADTTEAGSKKVYFFDAAGNAYVYSATNQLGVNSALKRLAVAEISGDKPTAKDSASIKGLDKAIDKAVPIKGDLVVVEEPKAAPKKRSRKAAPKKRPAAKRRTPKKSSDAGADALLAAAGVSESDAGADALLAAAGAAVSSGDDELAAMLANPRRNRRNGTTRGMVRKTARRAYTKRNAKRSFSKKQTEALRTIIPMKTDATGSEVDAVIARLSGVINNPQLVDQTVAQLAVKIVKMLPALVAKIREQAADKIEESAPMAPSAEDIVAMIQNVAVSGAHDEARRAADNADTNTIKRAWRLLTHKTRGRTPSEADMREAVLSYLGTKDDTPGVMTETGEPTESGSVDMPSDAAGKKEIKARIRAKAAEMMGGAQPRKPARRTGGKKTGGAKKPARKAPKVSAEDLAAGIDISDILGNPPRRRKARRKATRRNRF
jgi:hypothetical protein